MVCFHNFGGAVAAEGILCYPQVKKDVIKLQQVISKHEQPFIPTAI